jgi:GNAT superfamily N-acetyltransferase
MGVSEPLSPPEPLTADHHKDTFDSGEPTLDEWLKRRALANQVSGASRTYVACEEDKRVVGYYAFASGALAQTGAPGRFRRNMPDPIPVVVLARLAVDRNHQGRGLGRALFRDAAHRVAQAAGTIGIRGMVVHAISEDARRFYIALGFDPCPAEAMTLVVTLPDIRAILKAQS